MLYAMLLYCCMLLYLPPLHLVVEAEALKTAYRLRTNDEKTAQVQVGNIARYL